MFKQLPRLLAVLCIAAILAFNVTPAYACSAGPDFNAIAQSDIIVEGRLTDWQALEPSGGAGAFIPVQVSMNVERAFKGDISGQLQFVDRSSLIDTPSGTNAWAGGSGACGVFDADPTGMYAILGLTLGEDGVYQSNRLLVFFLGSEPSGTGYEQAVARLSGVSPAPPVDATTQPSQPVTLPDTGGIEIRSDLLAGLGIALTLAALGLMLRIAPIPLPSARRR
jgi:hypothetical protein